MKIDTKVVDKGVWLLIPTWLKVIYDWEVTRIFLEPSEVRRIIELLQSSEEQMSRGGKLNEV